MHVLIAGTVREKAKKTHRSEFQHLLHWLFFQITNATVSYQRSGKIVATLEFNGKSAKMILVVVLITRYLMYLGASRAASQVSHQLS